MMGSETDLAASVIRWLTDLGWEVFQEVNGIDIVATIGKGKGRAFWAIECKKSLTWGLLEQAVDRLPYAHRVSIACPPRRKQYRRLAVRRICLALGIGWIEAQPEVYGESNHAAERIPAPFHKPRFPEHLIEAVGRPIIEHVPAGSAGGRLRWSPFKATVDRLVGYVVANPGTTMKAAVEAVAHHYHRNSTASGTLSKYIETGIIKAIEWRRVGKGRGLYPRRLKPKPPPPT